MKKLLTVLLTLLMVFTLVGCNSKEDTPVVQEPEKQEEVVEQTKEEPEIVGGFVDVEDGTLTDELKDIFNKALEGLLGATYEPQELVATQVVAGTNYKFLANGTKTTNPITKGTYYITIYKDLQGNVSLLDIETIEEKQEEVKTQDTTQMSFWVVFYDQYGNELQRQALKYGTVPEYKSWLPEGFDKWVYKKSQKDVGSFKSITGNTYYQAVCHEVRHSSSDPTPGPTPGPTPPAPVTYTVTFDLNDISGTAPEMQTIIEGEKVTKPADPTDAVHTFAGWYKTIDATTGALSDPWDFDNGTVTADMTLYAQWTRTLGSIYGTNENVPKADNNTAPHNAWVNDDGGKAFIAYSGKTSEVLYFYKTLEPSGAKQLPCGKTENFTKIGDDYVLDYYIQGIFRGKYTLHMTEDIFTSVTYNGAGTDYEVLSGTYAAPTN